MSKKIAKGLLKAFGLSICLVLGTNCEGEGSSRQTKYLEKNDNEDSDLLSSENEKVDQADIDVRTEHTSLPPTVGSRETSDSMDITKQTESINALLARSDAVDMLRDVYASSPEGVEGRAQRWKAVYWSSKLGNKNALRLLEDVALVNEWVEPVEEQTDRQQETIEEHDHAGCGPRTDFAVRAQAGVGIVELLQNRVEGAESSVLNVLGNAEVDVSRTIGLELFIKGLLKDEHRTLLAKRGISADFRKHTPTEAEQLRSIDPNTLVPKNRKGANPSLSIETSNQFTGGGL